MGNLIKKVSNFVIGSLENFFERWGEIVASRPLTVILICLAITILSCGGYLRFTSEYRAEKLWIPSDSPYISNKAWLDKNFPRNTRLEMTIYESKSGNILTRDALLKMLRVHSAVVEAQTQNNITWSDVCYKIPVANIFLTKRKRKRRQADDGNSSPETTHEESKTIKDPIIAPTEEIESSSSTPDFKSQSTNESPENRVKILKSSRGRTATTDNESNENHNISSTVYLNEDDANDTSIFSVPKNNESISDIPLENETSIHDKKSKNPRENASKIDSNNSYEFDPSEIWADYDGADYEYESSDYDSAFEETFKHQGNEAEEDEIADSLPPEIYCDLVNTLREKCYESSILEIWRFDENRISKLTDEDIVNAINEYVESPVYGYKFNYSYLLGSVTKNSSGHIVGAKAAMTIMLTEIDPSKGLIAGGGAGIELDRADPDTLDWEKLYIETEFEVEEEIQVDEDGLRVFVNAGRSFNDISSEAIFFDGFKMVVGYLIMFAYTALMLGRLNKVEHRFYLTAAGILAVAMGLAISYGLSVLIGLPYTPIHAILPFLSIGIGIDDMFVILQCWYNTQDKSISEDEGDKKKSLVKKIGRTLRHAGVAITVTSFTDVFAFGIGAVTILPGLQAFCVSCAISIGSIYLLQASWFVAFLYLDERRIEAKQDGFFPCCIRHEDWEPDQQKSSQKLDGCGRRIMSKVAACIENTFFRIFVLVGAFLLLIVGVLGFISIKQEFDPVLLLPGDSYLRFFVDKQREHFTSQGWSAEVYFGRFNDLPQDLQELDVLVNEFENMAKERVILRNVDVWWSHFKTFLDQKNVSDWHTLFEEPTDNATYRNFSMALSDFLFSRRGSKYKNAFRFDGELKCGSPAPNVTASQFTLDYLYFSGPEEHIPAKRTIENMIKEKNFSTRSFSFSKVYAAWETDEVISFELWRNLALAMVCVFFITLILLANFRACLLVFLCVVLTLVDMVGCLHFWGVTIDTIACINIVLSVGLCVDYSAHIAHAYLVAEGTRAQRAQSSLTTMGCAILNGGVTTFLALVLLGFSKSHAFIVFFKVFFLTVLFGLFHGLIVLPLVLSIVGADSGHGDGSKSDDEAFSNVGSDTASTQMSSPKEPSKHEHVRNNNRSDANKADEDANQDKKDPDDGVVNEAFQQEPEEDEDVPGSPKKED